MTKIPCSRNYTAEGIQGLVEASLSSGHHDQAEPPGGALEGQVVSGGAGFSGSEYAMLRGEERANHASCDHAQFPLVVLY